MVGYFDNVSEESLEYTFDYLNIHEKSQIPKAMIRTGYASIADTVIFQMQDILELDNSARMNFPSTVGTNWRWRMKSGAFDADKMRYLKKLCKCYSR